MEKSPEVKDFIGGSRDKMPYSEMFKRKLLQKLTSPNALSASALLKQVDVPLANPVKMAAKNRNRKLGKLLY
ncbi:MAG: hypothetical protein PVI90_03425 [Desulfobacteraceae bacterium]|jgi:hypothetical protein